MSSIYLWLPEKRLPENLEDAKKEILFLRFMADGLYSAVGCASDDVVQLVARDYIGPIPAYYIEEE